MKIGDLLPRDKGILAFTLGILLIIPLANYGISSFLYWLLSLIGVSVYVIYGLYRYVWVAALLLDAGLLLVPYFLARVIAIRGVVLRYIVLSILASLVSVIISNCDLLSYNRFHILISMIFAIIIPAIMCYFSFGGYRWIKGSRYYGVMIAALIAISLLTNLASELATATAQLGWSQNAFLIIVAFRIVATVAALWAARQDELAGHGPYGGVLVPVVR